MLNKVFEFLFHPEYGLFRKLDSCLTYWTAQLGGWLYVVLFVIIFCETGLVILPFLPGDSLLFSIGVLWKTGTMPIDLPLMALVLTAAAVIGDAVNYSIGARIGPKIFQSETSRWLNKKHLLAAHEFYEKYGAKTIILARFIPIIRTFAPFVAGIGKMSYAKFALYNITGAILWVLSVMGAGIWFGRYKFVKDHFEMVVVAIIIISVLPAVIEFFRARAKARREAAASQAVADKT